MSKRRRADLYLRVSTDDQSTSLQRRDLMQAFKHRDWIITECTRMQERAAPKGREGRPVFDRLCQDATRRRFEVIAAWSEDRLGRSLQDLVGFLGEVHGAGMNLYLHRQAVDTTTPAGRAMFQMLGVFAEFERRVKAGLAAARAKGGARHAPQSFGERPAPGLKSRRKWAESRCQEYVKLQIAREILPVLAAPSAATAPKVFALLIAAASLVQLRMQGMATLMTIARHFARSMRASARVN